MSKILVADVLTYNLSKYDYFGDTRTVDSAIKRLRQVAPDTELIETVCDIGSSRFAPQPT